MIRKGNPRKNCKKRKQFFQGIVMGTHSTESLNCDLVEVSKLHHQLVWVYILSHTDNASQDNSMTRSYFRCSKSLVKKGLRRVMKHYAAMAFLMKTSSDDSFRKRLSLDICGAGRLPEVIILQAVHEGKIVLKRSLIRHIGGFKLNSGPKFYPDEKYNSSKQAEAPSFCKPEFSVSSEDVSRDDEGSLKDKDGYMEKVPLKSISVIRRELPETSTLGWPLLRRNTLGPAALRRSKARSMSLMEWLMNLPRRCSDTTMQNQIDLDSDEANMFFNDKMEDSMRKESIVEGSDDGSINREDEEYNHIQEFSSGSVSEFAEESTQLTLGWPLLHIKTFATVDSPGEPEPSNELVATCIMSEPTQSMQDTPESEINSSFKRVESSTEKDFCYWEAPGEQTKKAKLVQKFKSSGCKQFSFEELEKATRSFSSENLIGEGGCSYVYKGSLRWGKLVAVKVLKHYKEAWSDFSLEVDIVSSLKHKHITHLIGVCIEDYHLILVYNFLSKGSLEESLQGHTEKSILPWKMRFKVAIAVAEALDYLHNECSRPVIHRDVKSSNILLSSEFQPQLSDFGLAAWGPKDSAYMISNDVVGTFGYIAPEYFMNGRVSDKTDIYSFGIVLLELLTGKKPISCKGLKGHESLVKWATPLLESGNLDALVDPMLSEEYDVTQMHKMVLAANLCIKQSPRLRPKANQILKLLREDKDVGEWKSTYDNDQIESTNEEVGHLSAKLDHKSCSDSSSLVLDDDAASLISTDMTSLSSVGYRQHLKLKDYLQELLD
ncbi:protein kinase STUNTED isoform X2 [Ricinus communis]|uniref:protein kinase STUNTED isoform X2 n=1 Tax=Ricinus communis TaxID=3988 RepID=UPI00201A8E50|nr:protein kinase STUNTED isoform X2 [Ricinus communis]